MDKPILIGVAALLMMSHLKAHAADGNGRWKAEFDTQIGKQKYIFTFKQEGSRVTGHANADIVGEKRENELGDGKVEGDTLTFFEAFDYQGNAIRIDYKGTVGADEIKFTRKVGDFATEELVAKRVENGSAKPSVNASASVGQQKVVRLYDGPAPGSEDWTHSEKEAAKTSWGGPVVYNVTSPSLTVFNPEPGTANGTAVIICPGGAFFLLSINSEGNDVARWLNKRGVTCFVLRYRLIECKTDDPAREAMSRGDLEPVVKPVVPLAMADALTAIGYVRKNAEGFGVNPQRIGIIGFSAGGTVTASAAFNYSPETRPDFVAPIYPAYKWAIRDKGVPPDAPPMFILAATDDPLGLASQSVDLYRDWTAAKKPAELHLFAKGGHGFGMNKQNLPTDHWIDRFADWLDMQGFLKK